MLFWVNILCGALLCLLRFVTAPFLVTFYNEPGLFWVTVRVRCGLHFQCNGCPHSALLQRHMRFTELTTIEVFSLLVSYALGIALAVRGFGVLGSGRINDCHAGDQQRLNVDLHGLDTGPAARSRKTSARC